MDWVKIGGRIRVQRELFGYTRESFAEKLEITPKFCSDIELGVKGMSVQTLCKIADTLKLSTDYILFGTVPQDVSPHLSMMLSRCTSAEQKHIEEMLKIFIIAMQEKSNSQQQNTSL